MSKKIREFLIVEAKYFYHCEGLIQREVADLIYRKYGISVSQSTISNWTRKK